MVLARDFHQPLAFEHVIDLLLHEMLVARDMRHRLGHRKPVVDVTGAPGLRHDQRFRQRAAEMVGEFPPPHFGEVGDEGAVVFRSHDVSSPRQITSAPPSIVTIDPVANPFAMKLRICRAMSSAAPTRPTGNAAAVFASMSRRASSGIAARIGVSITPGETALTRTGANSSASARESDSSAPLAALTIAEFGRGRTLRKPETSVNDPPGRISACCATRHAPQNFPSIVPRTSSIATVLNGPVRSCAAVTTT